MQVVKHGTSFLSNLTNAVTLESGQLLEIPGLGNGTSVCSDDSRIEDMPTSELLVPSPRHGAAAMQRSLSQVCARPVSCHVSIRALHTLPPHRRRYPPAPTLGH